MLPKSPISALEGERLAGIGHNLGPPLDHHQSFRRFAWKKARAELLPRLPIEIVRRRVARARQLGLAYPQYASILLGTGRDIVGFLFTCNALGLRLERTLELPDPVVTKLRDIERCEKLLLSPAEDDPRVLATRLAAETEIRFATVAAAPLEPALWADGRTAVRAALNPLGLAPDAVVMIGTRAQERVWADAASLARFLPADQYFSR